MNKFSFLSLLLFSINGLSKETCKPFEYQVINETISLKKNLKSEDIKEIIVVDKRGKVHYLSINEFSVVPNDQVVTSKETIKAITITCLKVIKDPPKNLLGVNTVFNTRSREEPYGVSIKYYRNIYKNLYLGIQSDSLGTYSLGLSVSF